MNAKTKPQQNRIFSNLEAVSAALCAILAITAATAADTGGIQPQTAPLWQNAAYYLNRHLWLPGKVIEHEQTFGQNGQLEEETRVVLGLEADKEEYIRYRLLSAQENGRDVTAKARSVMSGVISRHELVGVSLFMPADPQQVTSSENGRRREINGHHCKGFSFRCRKASATVEGTAWLDEKTGLPLEIQSRTVSVPFMEEDIKVTSHEETESYIISEEGHCLIDRTLTKMDIEIPNRRFKGHVTTRSSYADHWEFPKTNPTKQQKYTGYSR